MLKRKVSVTKQRPSIPRVISKLSNLSQRNCFNVEMPKTRFNHNDRSISSPRIKSFPAEIIRRIDPSPVRNSSEDIVRSQSHHAGNSVTPANPSMNFGQGDTIPDNSYNQLSRSIAMSNQNTSTSDHEVSRNICSMENQPVQSEPMIVPRTMENPSNERPQHRPFVVPNSSPIASNLVGNSPRKFQVQRGQVPMPEVLRKADNETNQFQDPWKIENDSVRRQSDNEPIDESSKLYSSNVRTEPRKIMHQEYQRLPRGQSMTNPNISNVDPQNSSQIHPTLQHDHSDYWNKDNCQRRQFSRSDSGMTSPQDIAINQINNHRRSVHFGNVVCAPNVDNNANLPIVNDNPPSYYNNVPNGTHEMANQYSPENWQTQRQHYNHHDQSFPQKPRESIAQPKLNNQSKSEGKRKSLRFSSSMIRDQEMLVMTMRQQGISEDIMRRQFDALLAEQRKQLLYLEQLENRDTNDKKSQESRTVQRKISRIEEDGKPEWMLHITPPRIPYSVIEKMQSECQIVSPMRKNSDGVETVAANQSNGNQQFHHHESHDDNQRSWQHQMPQTNNWQPQDSYVCNNVTEDQNHLNPNAADHYQQRYYGYPVYNQPQSHQHQYNQHVAQDHWESRDNQHQKNQSYEEQAKNVKQNEASSLLKMRLYKDVIKRQKQNNGLQDSETIKRTLEAMKHPENCKGLEYLENLNKKHDKPVSLNGAQDPNDRTVANVTDPQIDQPKIKSVSANGLENSRNPNNPFPSRGLLRPSRIDEHQELEYPRRRTNVNNRYGLMAEKENGSVAKTMQQKQQQHSHFNANYSSHNQGTSPALNMYTRSENAFHHWAQMYPEMYENYGKSMANRTVSMPFQLDQNGQHQYYAQQMQQNLENRDKISDQMNPEHHRTINQSAVYSDQIPGNVQQHEAPCHLHQPLMIGGVKFLARKPQYTPNSIPMQPYQTNHGNNFNPMIACQ